VPKRPITTVFRIISRRIRSYLTRYLSIL